jgi:hypothetical protein
MMALSRAHTGAWRITAMPLKPAAADPATVVDSRLICGQTTWAPYLKRGGS